MLGVGVANRRNMPSMTRGRQPVTNDGGNRAPALTVSAVVRAGFTRDQQNDLEFLRYRLFEGTIKPGISTRQVGVVKVDADVRNEAAAFDATVPMAIEIMRNG